VIVDFLQDVRWPSKCDNENTALTQSMIEFKAGAMATRVPWIILSQFNRDPANKQRRPRMQDLRGSGSIEQSAHKILLMSRLTQDDRKNLPESLSNLQDAELEKLCLVHAAKVRGGRTGEILLKFNPQWLRFDNLTLRGEQ